MEEIELHGGDMTPVVRVGDTVRRSSGPWTPAVHALLAHLRKSGFLYAPKALGTDDRRREILSFLPGTVATYPLAPHVLTDDTLVAVAKLLRAYHDATVDFVPPGDAQWQWPPHEPQEVLCHNDFAPYNLLFENDRLTGVIDFDTASPGPRVWDMAYTAYRFVPLTDPANPDVRNPGLAEQRRRLNLFVDSYGVEAITPADVAATTIARLSELVDFIVTQARAGDPAQRVVLDRGDTVIYERDIAYIEASRLAEL
ncbi:phosphotransferase enzyme family protein [Rhodococcoides kyotonense]|uniref:Phosphotransferase enzyme family protein n=1 Tax=Rhodococcoides kyotonense TaxID=398843 RepID=A0A239MG20_9NOCA|nr:aminoglycoside phosphotransferase family protein [Rhodococcus kyotonensis]SNT41062.1 Phosphotransferase enzyme family protein [Rhodococcus kyotonensis]